MCAALLARALTDRLSDVILKTTAELPYVVGLCEQAFLAQLGNRRKPPTWLAVTHKCLEAALPCRLPVSNDRFDACRRAAPVKIDWRLWAARPYAAIGRSRQPRAHSFCPAACHSEPLSDIWTGRSETEMPAGAETYHARNLPLACSMTLHGSIARPDCRSCEN